MLHTDIHAAGYALEPEFLEHNVTSNSKVMIRFHRQLACLLAAEDVAVHQHSFLPFVRGRVCFQRWQLSRTRISYPHGNGGSYMELNASSCGQQLSKC